MLGGREQLSMDLFILLPTVVKLDKSSFLLPIVIDFQEQEAILTRCVVGMEIVSDRVC